MVSFFFLWRNSRSSCLLLTTSPPTTPPVPRLHYCNLSSSQPQPWRHSSPPWLFPPWWFNTGSERRGRGWGEGEVEGQCNVYLELKRERERERSELAVMRDWYCWFDTDDDDNKSTSSLSQESIRFESYYNFE